MIDWTDRHCRYFHRQLSRHARLYTEMIVDEAILRGDREYLLGFNAAEHPVALQLGGSDPDKLAAAAKIGEDFGYDEINLNVGCPSDRVQSGTFGACLMKTPDLVAECVAAMREAVSVPVTVKSRIGVDDQDPEECLFSFVEKVSATGCVVFIVHARKAWLQGLSPKENRTIPPLDYDIVRRLKRDHSDLSIILNGGIVSLEQGAELLEDFDGIMLGRAAYENPYLLSAVDKKMFDDAAQMPNRKAIIENMLAYIEEQLDRGAKLHNITRHMLGLFHGQPGARLWRKELTVNAVKAGAGIEVLTELTEKLPAKAYGEPV